MSNSNGDTFHIECEIQADVPTEAGNLYSPKALKKLVAHSNKQSERQINWVSVTDESEDWHLHKLRTVAGQVLDTKLEGDKVVCQVQVFPTECGKPLWEMLQHAELAPMVKLRPRAYGSATPNDDGHLVVDAAALRLVGWTFVMKP